MDEQFFKVLLIEDNPGDIRLLQEMVAEAETVRFELVSVERLAEAERRLDREDFDVILLDLSLPDAHGFDTFQSLHNRLPKLPIIVLTINDDQRLAVKAVKEGAQDYLVKGQVDSNLLVRSMRYAIERNRLLEELEAEYAQRLDRQERERQSMERLSGSASASVTAASFGLRPLREALPVVFKELVQRYTHLLDQVLEERAYKVEHNISPELRSMAEEIGSLRAGPRDVIEIHSAALKRRNNDVPPQKAQAYAEEGRMVVLELMGYLVAHYRNQSLGIKTWSRPVIATKEKANDKTEKG